MELTDNQVGLLGREIGREFADIFWENISKGSYDKMVSTPADYLLTKIGRAIGGNINLCKTNKEG